VAQATGFCGNLETFLVTMVPIGDPSLFTYPGAVQSPHLVMQGQFPFSIFNPCRQGIGPQPVFVTLLSLPLASHISVT
jgi:hypothetical protein